LTAKDRFEQIAAECAFIDAPGCIGDGVGEIDGMSTRRIFTVAFDATGLCGALAICHSIQDFPDR
jgi:hypothetical protein